MPLNQVIGAQVTACHFHKNSKTLFVQGNSVFQRDINGLLYITMGKAVVQWKNETFTVSKNHAVFFGQDTLREMRPHRDGPISYFWVGMDIITTPGLAVGFSDLGFPKTAKIRQPVKIQRLLRELTAASKPFEKKSPHSLQKRSILGLKLLCQLDENRARSAALLPEPAVPLDERVRKVLAHIKTHFKLRLDLKSLSEIAGMQRGQLNRLFKKDTGMSPHRYIMEMKMNHAREFLVLNTEYPGSVGLELGFHDYSHFFRTFKRMTGMTPSKYIKKHRKF